VQEYTKQNHPDKEEGKTQLIPQYSGLRASEWNPHLVDCATLQGCAGKRTSCFCNPRL